RAEKDNRFRAPRDQLQPTLQGNEAYQHRERANRDKLFPGNFWEVHCYRQQQDQDDNQNRVEFYRWLKEKNLRHAQRQREVSASAQIRLRKSWSKWRVKFLPAFLPAMAASTFASFPVPSFPMDEQKQPLPVFRR